MGIYGERFVLADFDGDGVLDVVAVQSNVPYGAGSAVLLRGSHVGGYSLLPAVTIANGDLLDVVTADFDRDGKPDLAMIDHANREVRVLRGLGAGLFAPAVLYSTGDDPVSMAIGDVNRDGALDLLIANGGTSPQLLMGVLISGTPTGTFTSRPGPYTPFHAVSMYAADLDGDQIVDIAVEEQSDTAVAIFRGRGAKGLWNGDWDPAVRYKLHDQPTYIRALDIDGDGRLDLVCGTYNGHSTTLLGAGGLNFREDSQIGELHVKAPFGVADWLHDGRKSLAIADPGEATLRLAVVNTPIAFANDAMIAAQPTRGNTVAAAVADLDGDGVDDAIAISRDSSMVSVMLSRCSSLAPAQSPGAGWNADGVALASTSGVKSAPRVTSDGRGGAFVAWSDAATAPAHVVVQHVLADGRRDPAWTEGGAVMFPRASAATAPRIVHDGGSGAWVAWDEAPAAGRGVYGARILSDGRIPAWWPLVGSADDPLGRSLGGAFDIREDGRRGWVQSWLASPGDDARLQRFTGAGATLLPGGTTGLPIGGSGESRSEPLALADGATGTFTCWRTLVTAGALVRLTLQRTRDDGSVAPGWPAGGIVLASATSDRHLVDAQGDQRGGLYVLWSDSAPGTPRLFAQHVDSAGARLGPAAGIAVSTLAATQADGRLAVLPDGSALVAFVFDGGDGGDLYVQHLAGGGLAGDATPAGRALCTATGAQLAPVILADGLGGAFVAWQDHRGSDLDVYASRIDGTGRAGLSWAFDGTRIAGAAGDQSAPQLASLGSGQAIVVWSDARSGVAKPYAARLSPISPVTAVETPRVPRFVLTSVMPNPTRGRFALRYALPTPGTARLEVLDVAGRRMLTRELHAADASEQEWSVERDVRWAPGVYLVRLTHAGEVRSARVVLLR